MCYWKAWTVALAAHVAVLPASALVAAAATAAQAPDPRARCALFPRASAARALQSGDEEIPSSHAYNHHHHCLLHHREISMNQINFQ